MKLVPLSRGTHATTKLRPQSSFLFAAKIASASLYATEVPRGAQDFPIAFTAEQEGFFPAAILGLDSQQNLFVDAQGRWLASYIPAVWRRNAFRLAKRADSDDWVVCLDEESDLLSESEGVPLFNEDGEPTLIVTQASEFLATLERDRVTTLKICATLDRFGLITPWELKLQGSDGAVRQVQGLYRIDEMKIPDLSAEALVELRDVSALPIIYGHLFSLHRLNLLARLAIIRAEADQQQKALSEDKLNLDKLFGIVEDDPFVF